MLLGASALGAVELAGRERPGIRPPSGAIPSLRTTDTLFLNAVTALWGYANWGGARWARAFFPSTPTGGLINPDWAGSFYSGDGNMTGGFWG
jgi:hypothetical protein